MKEFDINNINGDMFIEPRSDGGVGIYTSVSKESKSIAMALTKEEFLKMAAWIVAYAETLRS